MTTDGQGRTSQYKMRPPWGGIKQKGETARYWGNRLSLSALHSESVKRRKKINLTLALSTSKGHWAGAGVGECMELSAVKNITL